MNILLERVEEIVDVALFRTPYFVVVSFKIKH